MTATLETIFAKARADGRDSRRATRRRFAARVGVDALLKWLEDSVEFPVPVNRAARWLRAEPTNPRALKFTGAALIRSYWHLLDPGPGARFATIRPTRIRHTREAITAVCELYRRQRGAAAAKTTGQWLNGVCGQMRQRPGAE